MTRRIFRSIFAVALTVLLAALMLIMGVLHAYFTDVQTEQLRIETALASHAVANEGFGYFDRLDDTMDCRITWIDADGTVLYDNRSDTDTMVNHLAREEIRMALTQGFGQSIRYSDTLLERYIYAAERLPDGTVLRLSAAQSTVLTLMLDMSWSIFLVIATTVLLSYFLAKRLSRGIIRPLYALDLNAPLPTSPYEELTPLFRHFHSQQLLLENQSQELKRRQKEFNTVTQSLNEGLVLLNTGGTILSINPSAARLLEVTPNCLGADFSVASQNESINTLVEKALSGKKQEQTVSLSTGQYLAAASPVRSGGILSGVVLLLFDVTQKHQAEQLRREFTANVSHELKTPLHSISGYSELMKDGIVPPSDIPVFSEKIYAEAQRMIRLVENTLRLSRLDEGETDMQRVPVDLHAAACHVVSELAAPAELAQITIHLTGDPVSIPAIPHLINGILFNLTDNAIKYNRPGGRVVIRLEERDQQVLLTVSDNGIGISQEHRERIFERFYRVDKSRSQSVGGTGLGLSLVKHAALILGADIHLDSTPGKGTSITILFPKA